MGVISVIHGIGVVADIANQVLATYHDKTVETGSVEETFRSSQHPCIQSLLAVVPRLGEIRGQDLPRRFLLPGQPQAEVGTPDTVAAREPTLQVRSLMARFPMCGGLFNRMICEVHVMGKIGSDL